LDNIAKIEVECPWCNKLQTINKMPPNMIMAFNCKYCSSPVVFVQNKPIKIDREIVKSGQLEKLQEFILNILEKEFNIKAEISDIEQMGNNKIIKKFLNNKKLSPISQNEVNDMKKFLDNYKVPRAGEMF